MKTVVVNSEIYVAGNNLPKTITLPPPWKYVQISNTFIVRHVG